jgi:hypothetical protein
MKHADVVRAYLDGKVIQSRHHRGWLDLEDTPKFYPEYQYRVKPEPVECWVNVYTDPFDVSFHTTRGAAVKHCSSRGRTILMREVMEGEE